MPKKLPSSFESIRKSLSKLDAALVSSDQAGKALERAFRHILSEIGSPDGALVVDSMPLKLIFSARPDWDSFIENPEPSALTTLHDTRGILLRDEEETAYGYLLLEDRSLTAGQENLLNLSLEKLTNFIQAHLRETRHEANIALVAQNPRLMESMAKKWGMLLSLSIPSDAYGLMYGDNTNGEVVIQHVGDTSEGWQFRASTSRHTCVLPLLVRSPKVITIPDLVKMPEAQKAVGGLPGHQIRSAMLLPFVSHAGVTGQLALLRLDDNATPYSSAELRTAEASLTLIGESLMSAHEVEGLKQTNTKLENLQRDLTKSRNTLRNLIDNLPESLYIIDRNYIITALNSARAARLGSTPRKHFGKLCYETLYHRAAVCEGCLAHYSFETGKPSHRYCVEETPVSVIDWEINTYAIPDEYGNIHDVVLVEHDVTEKNKTEHALLQSEKLAAVGQLAAGVAHEINNPLTAVLANSQLLLREIPDNTEWKEMLELIHRGGSQALQSVKHLLNMARDEEFELVEVDINDSLDRAISMLKHEINRHAVHLKFEPAVTPVIIPASPSHLQSVWLNLLLNAIDSMQDKKRVLTVTIQPGKTSVSVQVSDTGRGIPGKDINKVFEPFYTTKDRERGTGLGLPIAYKIIRQHGGSVTVSSKLGAGSKFTVSLPRVR